MVRNVADGVYGRDALESQAEDLGVSPSTLVSVALWHLLRGSRDRRLEVVSRYFKTLSEEVALDEYDRGNGFRLE